MAQTFLNFPSPLRARKAGSWLPLFSLFQPFFLPFSSLQTVQVMSQSPAVALEALRKPPPMLRLGAGSPPACHGWRGTLPACWVSPLWAVTRHLGRFGDAGQEWLSTAAQA